MSNSQGLHNPFSSPAPANQPGAFPNTTFPQGESSQPLVPQELVIRKKKPLYKKWWAWLIAILIIGGIGSALDNDSEDNALTSTSTTAASAEATESPASNLATAADKATEATTAGEEVVQQADEEASNNGQPETTLGQSNAIKKARDYLKFMPFSRSGLVKQLEFEGFSTDEATYGVDNITVNWNEQAAKKAQEYLDLMAFSREELITQLVFEGFSQTEAEYGATSVGY